MAKIKLALTAKPTFTAKAAIPIPGAAPAEVTFTYKYRNRAQYKEFCETLKDRDDADLVMDMASGWDLDEPFTEENIKLFAETYIGAPIAVLETYIKEITGSGHRAKN